MAKSKVEKAKPNFKPIATFDKSDSASFNVQKLWFDDPEKYFIDIREMFKADSGKLLPTKKGVSIPPDILKKIIDKADLLNEEFVDGRVLMEFGSDTRKIRVSFSSFKKAKFLDVRYFFFDKESGEFKPTPKGITIPDSAVDEFAEFLRGLDI